MSDEYKTKSGFCLFVLGLSSHSKSVMHDLLVYIYALKQLIVTLWKMLKNYKYLFHLISLHLTVVIQFKFRFFGHLSNSGSHIVKIQYFFKNLLLHSQAWIRQTKYKVMITKEGCTKIVTFLTPGAVVLALGCGHISHIVKMHYFFKNLLLYFQV